MLQTDTSWLLAMLSDLTIAIHMHMRNSEYSSPNLLPLPLRRGERSAREGLA
ncbi:hypothetical protein OIDMADRAFT_20341 [Oidiodendron maius Zn]|uniref:Uncharacterized protein n=1 Tax=Oidiodendron maius (strain Zn) TaxID=913774 RepID=A0A0C3GPT2_OIDMZ|nr:hypothetical protein OIDMADRAFT_20341 [Oidiodendron maius Zn]